MKQTRSIAGISLLLLASASLFAQNTSQTGSSSLGQYGTTQDTSQYQGCQHTLSDGSCADQSNYDQSFGNQGINAGVDQFGTNQNLMSIPDISGLSTVDRESRDLMQLGNAGARYLPRTETPVRTEFQQLVRDSFGAPLPLFGEKLFTTRPLTFAPVDRVPVPADYVIGPGDELAIRIWGPVSLNLRATVDRNGQIFIPKVGTVGVAGVQYSHLEENLHQQVSRIFKNFELSATIGRLRTIDVYVVGRAKMPGRYSVSSLSSVVAALFASGGPSSEGSLRNIEVRREGKTITTIDLYDLLLRGDKSKDVTLLGGDVIYIPPVGPLVALGGSVNSPAIYEIKEHSTLRDLLDLGGGISTVADGNKITLERIEAHHERTVEELPLDDNKVALQDGDVVRVFSIVPRFANAVTLRGNVANPGRYPWHQGMKISDLIPNKEMLLTRRYWLNQNSMVEGRQTQYPVPLPQQQRMMNRPLNQSQQQGTTTGTGTSSTQQQTTPQQQNYYPQDQSYQQYPYYADQNQFGGTWDTSESRRSAMGQYRDQNVDYSREATQTGYVSRSLDPLRTDVKLNAPEINWDYAVVQRINPVDLSTRLIPFDLGKVILDHNQDQNLTLEAGDTVTIFSQSDITVPQNRQSRFIRIEGEVKAPGIYKIEPGDTLRSILQKAGGLTPNAYLYGSMFTRRSAQIQQQKTLEQIASVLETQVEQRNSTNLVSRPEELTAIQSRTDSNRRVIENLRQTHALGRMVLGIRPADMSVSDVPELMLEDGDRLLVPPKSQAVSVVGSVFNQSSFRYHNGAKVKDYLKLVGKGTSVADVRNTLLVRADGSVLTRKSTGNIFHGNFEDIRMLPGDTLVIPTKMEAGVWARNLRDWSQIASQLAITGASLAVVF